MDTIRAQARQGGSVAEIGPVQLVAIAFPPEAQFEGRIMAELAELERTETIRILDLLFVSKDAESGDLIALDYQGEELGAIIGALLGFDFEGDDPPTIEGSDTGHAFGLSREQIDSMGEELDPGYSAGFLLVEHVWALKFKSAVRDAGGVPIAEGFLTPEAVADVGPQLAAMAEAIEEVKAE
jgi:uncharacterized membrane protein